MEKLTFAYESGLFACPCKKITDFSNAEKLNTARLKKWGKVERIQIEIFEVEDVEMTEKNVENLVESVNTQSIFTSFPQFDA